MFGINRLTATSVANPLPVQLPASKRRFPLDTPLLAFSDKDPWSLRSACEGTTIMGGTGSGKSSSTGKAIAKAFCRTGMGGVVLCAKPSERDTWLQYARETGREQSVIVIDTSCRHRFNFLDYETRRVDRFTTQNLVSLFMRIMDAARGGGGNDGDNRIWRDASAELLSNCFLALYAAYGTISLSQLYELIETAPQTREAASSDQWKATSFCFKTLSLMAGPEAAVSLPKPDILSVGSFFARRWASRSDRTRSSIEMTLSSLIYPFLTGYMRELFCTGTNVIPEMTHEGTIIILDLPIKENDEAGILAQQIFKYLWQRATERRKDSASDATRPVFCFADECQFFVSEYDLEFQSTARSSKACTVYITQNLPTYYARMGGKNPQHAIDALLGNFQTKIFHQNLDPTTNNYASDLIGKQWMQVRSQGVNEGYNTGHGESFSTSHGGSSSYTGQNATHGSNHSTSRSGSLNEGYSRGTNENYADQVQQELLPSAFAELRKGGFQEPPEAIVIQGGRTFNHSGRKWLRCSVHQ